jgi:23S rRNA (adenine2030-N6)-methyltransferase
MKYRHAFHAGNFADVHKHIALLCLLESLAKKDKGFLVLDTHAGAGLYALTDEHRGARESEWHTGIGKLWEAVVSAPEIAALVQRVRDVQPDPQRLTLYPGSPLLAAQRLRQQDRLHAVDSEAETARELQAALPRGVRGTVQCGDGYHAVRAMLPPPERRGLILIDPPYEAADDTLRTLDTVIAGLERFATGVYAVWLPIKHAADLDQWLARFAARVPQPKLVSQLWLYPRDNRVALTGSCMVIVNPPYQMAERMRVWLPELVRLLAGTAAAGHEVREIDVT